MDLPADPNMLPLIDKALAAKGWMSPVPAELRQRYQREQLRTRQPHNRRVLVMLTIIFDLFWFAQFQSVPQIVPLSGLLRFAVMSPAVALFIVLDRKGWLDRIYGLILVTFAVIAGMISAVLTVLTPATTTTAMGDIQATPLVLLGIGLVTRLAPLEVVMTAVISVALFIGSILLAPSIPHAELGSLILLDVAIGAGAIVFNLELEARDRRVFLLHLSEGIQRAELAARNRGLLKEAQTDGLTGAANRRCFDETLADAWQRAQRDGGELSLIMMDIDHFKRFNDHYGHLGGDDCLRRVASQARREVRTTDLFARYGGEEFAVILPDAPALVANAIAERIRANIEALALPHAGLQPGAVVTVSLGVATARPARQDDARHLFEAADTNLYTAKRTGRNMVCVQAEPGEQTVVALDTMRPPRREP